MPYMLSLVITYDLVTVIIVELYVQIKLTLINAVKMKIDKCMSSM